MLTKKKKLSKKEIKEDKLVELYYKSQAYFEENKNRIILYAGVLVVIIAAVYFYMNYRSQQNDEAGRYLGQVMDVYDTGSYLEAIEGKQGTNLIGLKKIVQDYGSTPNGETAKIYLADCYANLGKEDEALKYYKDYGGDIDIYVAASLAGQAGILRKERRLVLLRGRTDRPGPGECQELSERKSGYMRRHRPAGERVGGNL